MPERTANLYSKTNLRFFLTKTDLKFTHLFFFFVFFFSLYLLTCLNSLLLSEPFSAT